MSDKPKGAQDGARAAGRQLDLVTGGALEGRLFREVRDQLERSAGADLEGQTVGPYLVHEKLGQGGMGVVHRATDGRLDRIVALKFLSSVLTDDPLAKRRLLREARIAAAIDHANVCTIFDIGETEDATLYLAMAYYEGATLREMLGKEPLGFERATKIARSVAAGLAAGHDLGIVHRDIKPSNVLVTRSGDVKILDFGIATSDTEETLTEAGGVLGTPGYMAPEQVRGQPADARADVWALGVLLYEMLCGVPPFRRDSPSATLYAIVNEPAAPLRERGVEAPERVIDLIETCLAKDPGDRPASTSEVFAALEPGEGSLRSTHRPESPTLTVPDTLDAAKSVPSLAVLPFTDMSADKDQGYFCEGIAEEILTTLGRLPGLEVAARIASFQFRDGTSDPALIGRKLGVEHILQGSVRKQGDQLRITVHLVSAGDGHQLWSHRYDRKFVDVFAVQEDIATQTVNELGAFFPEGAGRRLQAEAPRNIWAYEPYLRARYKAWEGDRASVERACTDFRAAIERDASFGRAYAGLADCHAWLYYWYGGSPADLEAALQHSRQAIELSPDLAEAHTGRGNALGLIGKESEAEAAFESALRIDPKLFEAYWFYGRFCWSQGRLDRAVELFGEAARVRPEDFQALILAGTALQELGRHDEAQRSRTEGLARARHQLDLQPKNVRALALGGGVLVETGNPREGFAWIERSLLLSGEEPWVLYNAACSHARAGNLEQSLELLERAVDGGIWHRQWLENDPDMEALRSRPEFVALLDRLK